MTNTVAGIHLGLDVHGSRPAANTVPDGSQYSCSTHGLIYKSNYAGNSWATWATLGTAGALADPMTTRGDIIVRNASNVTARLAIGSAGKAVVSDGTDVAYGYPSPSFTGWHLVATGVTMTSGAAWTVPFASEASGRDTNAYHDTSTNNTRCTVPSAALAGLYRVTFNVRFPGAFTGATWIGIAKGGTWQTAGQFQPNDAGANTDRQASVTVDIELANGNYVECGGLFCATTRTDLAVDFSGEWLGA